MKGDISDSLKDKYIDSAFKLIEAKAFPDVRTGYVCLYNNVNNKWEIFEDIEFITKFVKPKKG